MSPTFTKLRDPGNARLKELAAFVKSRREALSPEILAVPDNRKRRVKGLRREEIAELAGISTDWYAWIEQGRDLNLSTTTLENLACALQLDALEKVHLFKLAGHAAGVMDLVPDTQVRTSVQQLLDNMPDTPAYILDSFWNIKAWNKAACELFGDFERFPVERRNMVRLTFAEPSHQRLFCDLNETTKCTLAHFRADSAENTGTPEWQQLVEDLLQTSLEFARLWPLNSVSWPNTWIKTMLHPKLGKTTYHTLDLELSQPAKLRLITYLRQ